MNLFRPVLSCTDFIVDRSFFLQLYLTAPFSSSEAGVTDTASSYIVASVFAFNIFIQYMR